MTVLDLGSNTLRVLALDCETKVSLYRYSKVVKTADGLATSGLINSATVERIVSAIKEAQSSFSFEGEKIRAVTTEALRQATNAQEVLAEIGQRVAVYFDIISGEEEARLTLLAVSHRLEALALATQSFVTIDIGGGSTEVTFKYAQEVHSKSFPLGIVTTAQSYTTLEEIRHALPQTMQEITAFCTHIYQQYGKPERFVATAGTPTTVMAMKLGQTYASYDAESINGGVLSVDELDTALRQLLDISFEEREVLVGTGRADLIAAGILIYKELYRILDFDRGIVIDDGLREGLALDSCSKKDGVHQTKHILSERENSV